jgi:hypothetical protein
MVEKFVDKDAKKGNFNSQSRLCKRSNIHFLWVILCLCMPASLFSLLDTLTVSGNPSPMTINTAVAGQQPTSVSNSSTTYSVIVVSLSGRSITGQLNANMPSNVTLKVALAAQSGSTSAGSVAMSTTAQNLVTGIPIITISAPATITYTLSATVNAAQVTNGTRVLTLTLQ